MFLIPKIINDIKNNSNSIVVKPNISKNKCITETEAKELAIRQFKKLNETINKEELEVVSLKRFDESYYYIVGKKNSVEIKIKGGEITRINGTPVEDFEQSK